MTGTYAYLESPGIHYKILQEKSHKIHIFTVDANEYQLDLVRAHDKALGLETVFSMAARKGALLAINGGFFQVDGKFDGLPAGAIKINQQWFSLPQTPRSVLGWNNSEWYFDRISTQTTCIIKNETLNVDGVNIPPRLKKNIFAYLPTFAPTTLTPSHFIEIIVVDDKIQQIVKGGNAKIPPNGFVLSIRENAPLLHKFTVGSPITLKIKVKPLHSSPDNWQRMDNIVNGIPLLIMDGKPLTDYEFESVDVENFINKSHARTAIGRTKTNQWLIVVAEHQYDLSQSNRVLHHLKNLTSRNEKDQKNTHAIRGLTIPELREFMLQLGCHWAINLDGGGSSTLVYNGKIMNNPYPELEEYFVKEWSRLVSDALILRKK
ncbi:MAG TPA: phosphodiester glycosidase family protein [Gammaproteobacteria bacterium]|nr:phosphodiester glycosidase family protein [Gammaproteobacteria bacterium]